MQHVARCFEMQRVRYSVKLLSRFQRVALKKHATRCIDDWEHYYLQACKQPCDLNQAQLDLMERTDLNGQSVPVSYEHFPPFFNANEKNGELKDMNGILPELLDSIAVLVNISIKYIPFKERNVWGRKNPDGSWGGAIADIANREFATSVGAFVPTLERFDIGKSLLNRKPTNLKNNLHTFLSS